MRISDWSSDVCSSDLIQLEWLYDRYHQFHFGPLCCCAHVTQQGPCQNPKWALNKGFRLNMNIPAPKFCAAQWPCLNFRQQRQWVASYSLRRYPVRNIQAIMTAQTTRSEEHTSELQSLMRISYAVFCLKKKKKIN